MPDDVTAPENTPRGDSAAPAAGGQSATQLEHRVLTGAPTPHAHSGSETRRIMFDVVIALLPAAVLAPWFFGLKAAVLIIAGVVAAELSEALFKRMTGRPPMPLDGSATVTGLLLAMLMPASMPWYYVAMGSVVAIGLGKWAFGGLGQNPFNPALIAYVFLKVSFPARFAEMPANLLAGVDSVTQATPLGIFQGVRLGTSKMADVALASRTQMFWGLKAGALGEVSAAALILGGAYLLARKVITWHVPAGYIGTVAVLTGGLWLIRPGSYPDPVFHLVGGGLMLGAFFMATDPSSIPITRTGRLAFGVGCGVLTTVIRTFGGFAEGVAFSILLMNAVAPAIDAWLVAPAMRKERADEAA